MRKTIATHTDIFVVMRQDLPQPFLEKNLFPICRFMSQELATNRLFLHHLKFLPPSIWHAPLWWCPISRDRHSSCSSDQLGHLPLKTLRRATQNSWNRILAILVDQIMSGSVSERGWDVTCSNDLCCLTSLVCRGHNVTEHDNSSPTLEPPVMSSTGHMHKFQIPFCRVPMQSRLRSSNTEQQQHTMKRTSQKDTPTHRAVVKRHLELFEVQPTLGLHGIEVMVKVSAKKIDTNLPSADTINTIILTKWLKWCSHERKQAHHKSAGGGLKAKVSQRSVSEISTWMSKTKEATHLAVNPNEWNLPSGSQRRQVGVFWLMTPGSPPSHLRIIWMAVGSRVKLNA